MGREFRARTFKSGNSVALRLPKGLGVAEGIEMIVREEHGKFAFEQAPSTPPRIDLTGIWGSCPGLAPLTEQERTMEPRDLDWDRARLQRD